MTVVTNSLKIDNDGFAVEGYSAGMRGGKIWGYENAHRVPCFIRWPAGGIGGGKDMIRPFLSLKRLSFDQAQGQIIYQYGKHSTDSELFFCMI